MTQNHAARCAAFEALHDRRETFIIPNPWDAGSARDPGRRRVQGAGDDQRGRGLFARATRWRGGAAGGAGQRAGDRRGDGAAGLGRSRELFGHDQATVAETIRLAFATGLAGGSVEDASGIEGEPIYKREHAVARVEAAVAAARNLPHKFTLTARAEGFLHGQGDLGEVIARLQAFERAGADVCMRRGCPIRRGAGAWCRRCDAR